MRGKDALLFKRVFEDLALKKGVSDTMLLLEEYGATAARSSGRPHALLMRGSRIRNAKFQNFDFSGVSLEEIVFEDCLFVDSSLAGARLTDCVFTSTAFKDCDLSDGQWAGARLWDVSVKSTNFNNLEISSPAEPPLDSRAVFEECSGAVSFEPTDGSGLTFEKCRMSGSVFSVLEHSLTPYRLDFNETDLSNSIFSSNGSHRFRARFRNSNLEGVDISDHGASCYFVGENRIEGAALSPQLGMEHAARLYGTPL